MSTKQLPGKVITFYSYKGGTGRSMAVANVAWILASNGKSVLVLDWDLEAPGLHRYFRPFLIDKELTSSDGIIDFVIAYADEAIKPPPKGDPLPENWFVSLANITRNAISVNFEGFPEGGSIALIPAGRQGATYATRVNSFDWKNFYVRLAGRSFMEEARQRMCEEYEYILIDSRTGVSDTSGICTVQMPDILAVCFTLNNQSIEGAAAVTKSVDDQRRKAAELDSEKAIGRMLKIVPIPMRIDPFEKDKLDRRRIFAQSKFEPFIPDIAIGDRQTYWVEIEVPYTPYFAYEELLSTFRENPSDPKAVLSAMIRITNYLLPPKTPDEKPFAFTSLISPQRKDDILQEFAITPGADSAASQQPVAVESDLEKQLRLAEAGFLSLDERERDEARRLLTRLVRVPRPGERTEISKVRVNLSDLGENMRPLAKKLAQSGLVSFGKDDATEQETVEISNEELLRSWPHLRDWIKQDSWLFQWRQELQINKAQWEESDQAPAELLHGRELDEASRWYETHRAYLNDTEATFIEASIREDEIRQKRERTRRIWLNAGRAAAVFLVAIGIYFFFSRLNKSDIADRIASVAQQKIDASLLGNQRSADQFQLGILLAAEAQRIAPSAKADAILKKNLTLLPRKVSVIDLKTNVLGVALSPSSAQVLSVTGRPSGVQGLLEDGAAQLNDVSSGSIMLRIPFKQGSRAFELNSDATNLAIASREKDTYKVEVLDTTGTVVATLNHGGLVYDMAFSPDGRYFATASNDRTAQVLDLRNPGSRPEVLTYTGALNGVAFSGDSTHLAIAGEDFQVHVRHIAPGQTTWTAASDVPVGSTAFTLALSPNGTYLATLSYNNKVVNIWDVASKKMIKSLDNGSGVSSVTFSPDSKFIITGGAGGNIKVWRLQGQGKDDTLPFEGDVDLVSFSPNEKYLAAVGNSKVARVWHYTGDSFEESAWLIQKSNFNHFNFGSADLLVTASADNLVRVWRLGAELTKDLQYEACARLTRNLTLDEWNEHLAQSLGAYRKTCTDIP